VQITYGDNSANPAWDQHSNLPKHAEHAMAVDKPIAGLLADLKQRGLLDETIVWWGGEFGRTPYAQKNGTGRDHNPGGFTIWLAGGGVKPGFAFGSTDEFGSEAIQGKVHMHDLHATLLHLLGLNHEQLTYRYAGRDFRLTDVAGRVARDWGNHGALACWAREKPHVMASLLSPLRGFSRLVRYDSRG
jgi:arylsulfatase A-like enzyme